MKNSTINILALLLLSFIISGCSQDVNINELGRSNNSSIVILNDGDIYQMSAGKVVKNINGTDHIMYGYNGQMPGPTLKIKQGSRVYINFTNNLDEESTIHWHGLRHNYLNDGIPDVSQDPTKPGDSFIYELYLPDDGIYWYHPHVREDRQQDLGLYGNILVEPSKIKYNAVDREEFITLDDILIEDGEIVPYGKEYANYALMGRYGNVMLTNAMTDYELNVNKGDTVRFYVTAVSNVRPFNFSISGTKLKITGGDMGLYEHEEFADSIIITPAERFIVEARFDESGIYSLNNINPWFSYEMGKILVSDEQSGKPENGSMGEETDGSEWFKEPKNNIQISADIDKYRQYFDKDVDINIELGISFDKTVAIEMHSHTPMEWEDFMIEDNSRTRSDRITWYIKDKKTGLKNDDLNYEFQKGDIIKINFDNNIHSPHPMQHYVHLHGQRFLVIEENGIKKHDNLVWKDTFLIPNGGNVTILLDVSNPGKWMIHCHIPEHMESGMMASFEVD